MHLIFHKRSSTKQSLLLLYLAKWSTDKNIMKLEYKYLQYKNLPLSSTKTTLLLSNFGLRGFWFCRTPTSMPFFFSPLMATRTLSPENAKVIKCIIQISNALKLNGWFHPPVWFVQAWLQDIIFNTLLCTYNKIN